MKTPRRRARPDRRQLSSLALVLFCVGCGLGFGIDVPSSESGGEPTGAGARSSDGVTSAGDLGIDTGAPGAASGGAGATGGRPASGGLPSTGGTPGTGGYGPAGSSNAGAAGEATESKSEQP
jgi:hypothetical protein